ncbi:hypothetical protein [Alicyclobacillus acidoterrestris]|uniref:Uncharacterized protein n=1 Tax=Alicyclobacillus acidoterrestris (strain ATCC 49025 / DSM 3922 / CIP 106132 / NCIMB 13137 / GD3B) TaxID=1356854 RepID=T0BHV9_ALIAG|nr:hypothetical protein [Alicyclobacillus acidoterrestris]EPZ43528.1 hypothetical protein N007_12530 [Alicyclobacillus acidoterrestris ATCC 49025]UNO50207.1 hypothetical protein K1I37_06960 [Alicyclobacillus acidoterrestris]
MDDEKRQMDVFQVMRRFPQLQRLMTKAGRIDPHSDIQHARSQARKPVDNPDDIRD